MMNDELRTPTGSLNALYPEYERQKCFVGYSMDTSWHKDLVAACSEVLEEFDMEPWYATEHFAPTQSLRDKVVELIANTRYGIYDLSCWRKDDKGEWQMPRNVFIELGIAIALNRPLLMLRHSSNSVTERALPQCLESVSTQIVEFSGPATLTRKLRERLSQWKETEPEKDWWNRYCIFGDRICEYRETYPQLRQWSQETLHCHISDGRDFDRYDFRDVVEEVLERFDDVTFSYLDGLSLAEGYTFLLCSHCQAVRSSPFAIYRISDQTPAETFIAIGMSLALETQFEHKIPKILLTSHAEDIPSLLAGYDVVVARDYQERKSSLRKFTPKVIHQVRKTTWKARPLPFIEVVPRPDEQPASEGQPEQEPEGEYLAMVGKYGLMKEIGRSEIAVTYLVRDTESGQLYAMKRLHANFASDARSVTRFQRAAEVLCKLNDPRIIHGIEQGEDGTTPYFVMEYVEGQPLRQLMSATGPMEVSRAINYARQIAEGLDAAHKFGVVHRDIRPEHILVDSQDQIKISEFGSALEEEVDERSITQARESSPYSMAPEVLERSRSADARSDLYALAVVFFDMLAGHPPFTGEFAVDIAVQHMNTPVPSLCLLRPDLLGFFDFFMQKAMAKSPGDRYQTPSEVIAALDQLQQAVALAPVGNRTLTPVNDGVQSTRGLHTLIGQTLDNYRLFDYLGTSSLSDVFKAYEPSLDRIVVIKVVSYDFIRERPQIVEIFERELRALALLSHPNLVSIYGFGEQGKLYIAEEYVDGGSLRKRLQTGLGQQEAVEYIIQAAEGLGYLHSNDIVHQDVQPGNMLLRSDDHLLLSNWETLIVFTRAGTALSYTPVYQPPEQEEGRPVDQRGNIYSLGINLFECLAGILPMPAPGAPKQIPIWFLRSAYVPIELQRVIVKMVQRQPEERYQSMQEVIEALRAAQAAAEQALQEEHTVAVGMDRCAFCDAATSPEDELCANCGKYLLAPKFTEQLPAPAWGQQITSGWGQQSAPAHYPPAPYSDPNATIRLDICPVCGEDFQPDYVSCPNCGYIRTIYGGPGEPTAYPPSGSLQQPEYPYWSPAPQMKFCPACGAAIQPGAEICACGNRLVPPSVCPNCGTPTRLDDKFCLNCGNRLPNDPWKTPAPPDSWVTLPSSIPWGSPPSPGGWGVPDPLQQQAGSWGQQLPQQAGGWGASPSSQGGAAKPLPCPYCGADTRPGDNFCLNCANRLPPNWGTQPGTQEGPTVTATDDSQPSPAAESEEASAPAISDQVGNDWTGGLFTFTQEDLNNIGKIFGDYRILRDIGQGGLGRVYLALHTTTSQLAAVKLFYSHLSSEQRQHLFFLQKHIFHYLHHPYILPIIEVNLHEKQLYLITEYASLGSLHDRIQSGQPLPIESAVTILSQTGEALAHIHQHNIVHRDLKPGNILFNERNDVLLSDFDIAVVLDTGESKKVNKWGSPPYMAPEQFEGVVSRQSDQYSLGCIAYRLVTGKRPFDDNNFTALHFKHMTQAPTAPRQLNPIIPKHIERAILKAMAKNPADRFPDMLAFIAALKSESRVGP